jgi:hypothetical protein
MLRPPRNPHSLQAGPNPQLEEEHRTSRYLEILLKKTERPERVQ